MVTDQHDDVDDDDLRDDNDGVSRYGFFRSNCRCRFLFTALETEETNGNI